MSCFDWFVYQTFNARTFFLKIVAPFSVLTVHVSIEMTSEMIEIESEMIEITSKIKF